MGGGERTDLQIDLTVSEKSGRRGTPWGRIAQAEEIQNGPYHVLEEE